MTIDQRIRRCILLEKMNKNLDYAKKFGLEDISIFKDKKLYYKGDEQK